MPPEKPKQPKRDGHEKKSLAKDEHVPTDLLVFQLIDPLPCHHEDSRDGNKVSDGHEDPTEVVTLLNSSNPIPPVIPVHRQK